MERRWSLQVLDFMDFGSQHRQEPVKPHTPCPLPASDSLVLYLIPNRSSSLLLLPESMLCCWMYFRQWLSCPSALLPASLLLLRIIKCLFSKTDSQKESGDWLEDRMNTLFSRDLQQNFLLKNRYSEWKYGSLAQVRTSSDIFWSGGLAVFSHPRLRLSLWGELRMSHAFSHQRRWKFAKAPERSAV